MNEPKANVTRVYERHGAIFVEGVVQTPKGNLKAAFTMSKLDAEPMDREAFRAFAIRQLPLTTEDKKWAPDGTVLV
jgi:hypothetical protein